MEIIFYRGKPTDRTILGVRENDDGSVVCWHGYRGGDGRTSFDGELVKMSVCNASRIRQQMREVQEKIEAGKLYIETEKPIKCLVSMKKIVAAVIDYGSEDFDLSDFDAEIRGEPVQDF